MGANSSATVGHGNPVLYTFTGFAIEPYWLIIIQLLVIQMLQRLYSRFSPLKGHKKTWHIPLEIRVLKSKENEELPPMEVSIVDILLSLVSVAHFIYACYRQTECSSSVNYTAWRCYNAFGYRLFNYVLPSTISVLVQSSAKLTGDTFHPEKKRDIIILVLLMICIVLNGILLIVFIPFTITNALPMLVGFCWLLIPLLFALIITYALFISTILWCKKKKNFRRLFLAHFAVGLQVFFCLIIAMAYNCSQYCYFGGGYLEVIGYEFNSRDTGRWGSTLVNSSQLQAHTILAFF